MTKMNMSFESEDSPLFPKFNEFSQDSFCSFGNKSFCDFNQANDCLCGRFNENGNGYDITSSSRNDNSVESNKKTGNFCIGEISTINQSCSIPLFSNNYNLNTVKDTKSTDLETQKAKTIPKFLTTIEISQKPKVIKPKEEEPPKYFPEISINVIIRQFNISKELKSNILFDYKIENYELESKREVLESNTVRRRRRNKSKDIIYRPDNILSQLINILNSALLNFINKLITALYTKEEINQILKGLHLSIEISKEDLKQVIKKNDYKCRYNLKKIDDIKNLLKLTLKEYFSFAISPKYDLFKYPSNYNELIIGKILQDETNKDIFEFILNDLTVMDWLDIFLYKKDLEDIEKFNSFYQKERIKESFEGIDHYIDKIIYKKDNIYFQCFALISYNLERFLFLKEKRKTTKKKKLIQPRKKKRRE